MTVEQAFQIAVAHQLAGRLAEAEAVFRQILAQHPQHADSWHRLAAIALTTNRAQDAHDWTTKALALAPERGDFHADLGVAHWALGRPEEAVACFLRALTFQPDMAHVFGNVAHALNGLGHGEAAIAFYRRGIELDPKAAGLHHDLAGVLLARGRIEEAAATFRRAIELDPESLDAQISLGAVLARLGQFEEAKECCQRALARGPESSTAHVSMAVLSWCMGEFEQSVNCYRRAIECDPQNADAHLNLGLLLLQLGRFREGWAEYSRYESRFHSPAWGNPTRHFTMPRWDGAPAPGRTIVVHVNQGLGDTIHFLRYLPLVRAHAGAARVVFACLPPLVRLVAESGGWNAEIAAAVPAAEMDLHVPLLSLPPVLGLPEPLPMSAPYLKTNAALRETWRARLDPGAALRVGLAWAGSAKHRDDRSRSIAFERLRPLLAVPGVQFYSLQVEPRAPATADVIDLTAQIADMSDTAALIAELDLIITVDTASAHLAGALGKRVWTLLPFPPDWRWGLDREDTPWYPTMRLFRQRTMGDWDEVVRRVADELDAMR